VRTFARENGLALFFASIFLVTLVAQALAGHQAYNAEQAEHGEATVALWSYISSAAFWGAVMENWQSEFLQFTLFVGATVWLVQKGSNESKRLEDVGRETDEQQRVGRHAWKESPAWAKAQGVRRRVYENSLLAVMTALFVLTWLGQSLNNWREFNADRAEHGGASVSWGRYLLDPDFWERTLQNWQSEFLAVGTMAVFTIYLRQRGSPESKPVGAPHDETASSG
jgi:hypothetical protein